VGLSGGVFQNRLLTDRVVLRLKEEKIRVYLPQALPCNDGGLCYGQIIETAHGLWNG
jgi:hydrogenase maturation protein HypF